LLVVDVPVSDVVAHPALEVTVRSGERDAETEVHVLLRLAPICTGSDRSLFVASPTP